MQLQYQVLHRNVFSIVSSRRSSRTLVNSFSAILIFLRALCRGVRKSIGVERSQFLFLVTKDWGSRFVAGKGLDRCGIFFIIGRKFLTNRSTGFLTQYDPCSQPYHRWAPWWQSTVWRSGTLCQWRICVRLLSALRSSWLLCQADKTSTDIAGRQGPCRNMNDIWTSCCSCQSNRLVRFALYHKVRYGELTTRPRSSGWI